MLLNELLLICGFEEDICFEKTTPENFYRVIKKDNSDIYILRIYIRKFKDYNNYVFDKDVIRKTENSFIEVIKEYFPKYLRKYKINKMLNEYTKKI